METDKKVLKYADLEALRRKCTKNKQTIVFTSGCYDILHLGHVMHFNYCKEKGDILVVSLGNDKTLRELKGPTRPINPEDFRARMIAALSIVDYVVISEEGGYLDHVKMIERLRPDFYVVPSTDKNLETKIKLAKDNGGKLIACKRLPPGHLKGGISVTKIVEKIKSL
jgi:rfaE bifunctional protein nucleotidyltransferase chain/domain